MEQFFCVIARRRYDDEAIPKYKREAISPFIYLGANFRPPFPLFCSSCLLAKRAPLRSGRSDCLVERLVFQYESKKCKVGRLCAVGAISQSAQSLLSIHYSVNPKIFNEVVETVIIIGSISSTVHSFGFA